MTELVLGQIVRVLSLPLSGAESFVLSRSNAPVRLGSGSFLAMDVIVVLGCPLVGDGTLSAVGEERVAAGVRLWRAGIAPIICMSGGRPQASRGDVAEAPVMARRAEALGVPISSVYVETRSRNTAENAARSAEMLLRDGLRRVVVVTQPFHLRRAVLWFRRAGFDAYGCYISDSLQFREPRRGFRWVVSEYGSLARDLARSSFPTG